MTDQPDELLNSLKREVNALNDVDAARASEKLALARVYVTTAVAGYTVEKPILDDCIVCVAADLYNSKNAQLGIMSITDTQMEPFRVSTDPLRSAWPKLNAAGIPTGGMAIS